MGDTVIKIKIIPRSSINKIEGFEGDTLRVKVKSAPVEGLANKDLIQLLSKCLRVAKEKVEIVSGHTSRAKIVKLRDVSKDDLFLLLNR